MSKDIKIQTYQRFSLLPEQQFQESPNKEDSIYNLIMLTTHNKKPLNQLEALLKQKYIDDINYVKCIKLPDLSFALNRCNHNLKTICVSDREINSQVVDIIVENQHVFHREHQFQICLWTEQIQLLNMINFHYPSIVLVTNKIRNIIDYVENKIQGCRKLKAVSSTSTINAEDKVLFAKKFDKRKGELESFRSEKNPNDVSSEYGDNLKSPGVGQYEVQLENNSHYHSFSKGPNRVDPKLWGKNKEKFGRME